MKMLNDEQIKKTAKASDRYEIKTSAESILLSAGPAKQEQKQAKPRKSFLPWLAGAGALVAATFVAVMVVDPLNFWKENPQKPSTSNVFDPGKNKKLANEILTFYSFSPKGSTDSSSVLRRFGLTSHRAIEERELGTIADQYERVEEGVRSLFDARSYQAVTVEQAFQYQEKTYAYETRFLDEESNIIARVYFNSTGDEDTLSDYSEALYYDSVSYYFARIEKEVEVEGSEREEEVKTILQHAETSDPTVYVVERETEYQGQSTERSYSYSVYENLADYRKDDDLFLESISFEFEDSSLEASCETRNGEEYEFSNIQRLSAYQYSFEAEVNDQDALVHLQYSSDYQRRTYSSETHQVVRGK